MVGLFGLSLAFIIFGSIFGKTENESCYVTEYSNVQWSIKNCRYIILDSLTVPGGATLDLQLRDGTILILRGITTFGYKQHDGYLVRINGNNLTVIGEKGSILDGQGQLYWDGMGEWSTLVKPNFLKMTLKNSKVFGLTVLNCPKKCSACDGCENVEISNMLVNVSSGLPENTSPNKTGHNTDGINISGSTNITLKNSTVINQDDCVRLGEAINITVSNMYCYGGHGLSIAQVKGFTEDVLFSDSVVINSLNGIHVKISANASGEGMLRNITYRNIDITGATDYGINIQENYVNQPPGSNTTRPAPSNRVPIHNLNLFNVTGVMATGALPVSIICAKKGCFNWAWSNVNIMGQRSEDNICFNYVPEGFSNCTITNNSPSNVFIDPTKSYD